MDHHLNWREAFWRCLFWIATEPLSRIPTSRGRMRMRTAKTVAVRQRVRVTNGAIEFSRFSKLRFSFLFIEGSQGKIGNSRMSPLLNAQVSSGDGFEDRQFVVLTSEKQARVVALPSQNCVYRQQLAETHIVIKAEITSLKGSSNVPSSRIINATANGYDWTEETLRYLQTVFVSCATYQTVT